MLLLSAVDYEYREHLINMSKKENYSQKLETHAMNQTRREVNYITSAAWLHRSNTLAMACR
jgi:hypothetical protein